MTIGISDPNNSGMPDRVVERARGCWNCIHYLTMQDTGGEIVQQQYALSRAQAIHQLRLRVDTFRGRSGDFTPRSATFYTRVGKLVEKGMSQDKAIEIAMKEDFQNWSLAAKAHAVNKFAMWDEMFRGGAMGMCMASKIPVAQGVQIPADTTSVFVHCQALCGTWTGKEGSSLATEGKPLDKLGDELQDRIDGDMKKSSS